MNEFSEKLYELIYEDLRERNPYSPSESVRTWTEEHMRIAAKVFFEQNKKEIMDI